MLGAVSRAPWGSRQGEVWCEGKWGKDSARRKGRAGRSTATAAVGASLMGTCRDRGLCAWALGVEKGYGGGPAVRPAIQNYQVSTLPCQGLF